MKLTEEQLEAARIELERRAKEKNKTRTRKPQATRENLGEYVYHECTEVGEYWCTIYELRENSYDYMSETFKKAIIKEIDSIVKDINEKYLEVIDGAGELIELEYVDA